MAQRYVPPTIDSYGGILPYLDATKNAHKGYGAVDLVKNWNWGTGKHLNITALSILFNVTWTTMADWLDRLHTESGRPRPNKEAKAVANTPEVNDNSQ